ncbi:hypothetical protein NC653_033223 [Populus alba x Populus x berolinensis]|uniref:Trichome birefringence-like C-terminal domain-containing protein n=1 Tax=Populus alba x Populus x berolinensis TaxID=444605 RepID=A0AAD6LT80_9ROSI|nr:hypothetical protein NC653_033223 [Populus alba x Populus x berolinensis]
MGAVKDPNKVYETHGRKITMEINYYQEGNQVHPQLDVSIAFRRAPMTWASWVERHINPRKTESFLSKIGSFTFQGRTTEFGWAWQGSHSTS